MNVHIKFVSVWFGVDFFIFKVLIVDRVIVKLFICICPYSNYYYSSGSISDNGLLTPKRVCLLFLEPERSFHSDVCLCSNREVAHIHVGTETWNCNNNNKTNDLENELCSFDE